MSESPKTEKVEPKRNSKGQWVSGDTTNPYLYKNMTPERQYEMCSNGGKAASKKRKLRRLQRDILREILALDVDDERLRLVLKTYGLPPDFANAMNLSITKNAAKGDVESARYIRDTIGEKPRESLDVGLHDAPVGAMDLSKLSDEELDALQLRQDAGDEEAGDEEAGDEEAGDEEASDEENGE